MSDWVKALGVDFGRARIGLAVSDDIGFLAHPLETVPAADLEKAAVRISEVVAERGICDLVMGLPLHMNGDEGDAVAGVREFTELLAGYLPDAMIYHEVDERLSTSMAMDKLHAAGRNAKNSKGIIDQAAAVEILQIWLDNRPGNELLPPESPFPVGE